MRGGGGGALQRLRVVDAVDAAAVNLSGWPGSPLPLAGVLGAALRYAGISSLYFIRIDRNLGQARLGGMDRGRDVGTVTYSFPGGASYKTGQAFSVVLMVNSTVVQAQVKGTRRWAWVPLVRCCGRWGEPL